MADKWVVTMADLQERSLRRRNVIDKKEGLIFDPLDCRIKLE